MIKLKSNFGELGLLVSVRNADEARAALAAGADVIDVKEPNHGSLGAADSKSIAAVVREVDRRAPVTAALGELVDLISDAASAGPATVPAGVSMFKIGLAACAQLPEWESHWRQFTSTIRGAAHNSPPQPVAVVYADWRAANAPSPEDVLQAAVELQCPGLLIDTWGKSAGDLFTHWPADQLQTFLDRVRSQRLFVVLAGSLTGESFERAVRLSPDLVAVRTAACEAGRNSQVSESRVRELKQSIAANSTLRLLPSTAPAAH